MMNDVKNSNPTQNGLRYVLNEHSDIFINLYIFTKWFPNNIIGGPYFVISSLVIIEEMIIL